MKTLRMGVLSMVLEGVITMDRVSLHCIATIKEGRGTNSKQHLLLERGMFQKEEELCLRH
jgi:hypothetical protein